MTDKSLMDQDIQECPWPFYKELRDEAPIYMDPQLGCAEISCYEDVVQAPRSPQIFSSKMGLPFPVVERRIYSPYADGLGATCGRSAFVTMINALPFGRSPNSCVLLC